MRSKWKKTEILSLYFVLSKVSSENEKWTAYTAELQLDNRDIEITGGTGVWGGGGGGGARGAAAFLLQFVKWPFSCQKQVKFGQKHLKFGASDGENIRGKRPQPPPSPPPPAQNLSHMSMTVWLVAVQWRI